MFIKIDEKSSHHENCHVNLDASRNDIKKKLDL